MANYERINWEDYPSTDTPLDSENLNKMDAAIDAINREVQKAREDIEDNGNQVELAHNRIDSLIALPDGSTTADAELIDGRIGYDNTQYNSLGAAIRGQVEDLHDALEDAADELNERLSVLSDEGYLPIDHELERGWIGQDGADSPSTYALRTIGYIPIDNSQVLQIYIESANYVVTVKTYDANKVFIRNLYSTLNLPPKTDYVPSENEKYIRYAIDSTNHSQYIVTSESGGVQLKSASTKETTKLSNDVELLGSGLQNTVFRIGDITTNSKTVDITNQFTLEDGYIDKKNGSFVSTATSSTKAHSTGYLNIYEYADLYISGAPLYSSNCLYAIYDKSKAFLGYYKDATVETDYHFYINNIIETYPAAMYVRFSSIITNTADLIIKRPSTISDIINDIHPWNGKKWTCVGDSLTEVNSRTTKHYYNYIAEATGVNIVNLGASGRGYKNPSSVDNKTFLDVMSEVPTDSDVVTIFGSGNDLTHGYTLGDVTDTGTTTICGCINETLDALIDRFPTVQLGIVAPTPWVNFPPYTANNAMELYVNALKTICANRSIPFLDLYHCSNLRPWTAEGRTACYSKDEGNGVHPDEEGHKLIAPRFKGFLDNLLI